MDSFIHAVCLDVTSLRTEKRFNEVPLVTFLSPSCGALWNCSKAEPICGTIFLGVCSTRRSFTTEVSSLLGAPVATSKTQAAVYWLPLAEVVF